MEIKKQDPIPPVPGVNREEWQKIGPQTPKIVDYLKTHAVAGADKEYVVEGVGVVSLASANMLAEQLRFSLKNTDIQLRVSSYNGKTRVYFVRR